MARRKNAPCRGCPPNPPAPSTITVAADKSRRADAKVDPVIINTPGEGQKLWSHVLYGTGTCLGMIEGYYNLRVPGDPLPGLLELKKRIDYLIDKIQHANPSSAN